MNEPSRDYQALLTAALRLPVDEQARLADELLRALGPDDLDPDLDPLELDRRDAELRDGQIAGLSLSDFETAMRRHLARQDP
jgi:hypothetical protein